VTDPKRNADLAEEPRRIAAQAEESVNRECGRFGFRGLITLLLGTGGHMKDGYRILTPGTTAEETPWRGRCDTCGCAFECAERRTSHTPDKLGKIVHTARCPHCRTRTQVRRLPLGSRGVIPPQGGSGTAPPQGGR